MSWQKSWLEFQATRLLSTSSIWERHDGKLSTMGKFHAAG